MYWEKVLQFFVNGHTIAASCRTGLLGARPIDLSTKKFLLFAIRFFLVPIKLFPCLAFHYTFFPFFMGARHSTGMRYGHEKKSKAAPRKKQSNFSSSKQHLFCCMLNKCLSAQRSFVAILLTCQKFIVDLLEWFMGQNKKIANMFAK